MNDDLEQKFYDRIQQADDMEEVSWLFCTYEAVRDYDWKNVSYRCWVLTEKYDQKHMLLVNLIDRVHGEEISEALDDA